MKRPVHPPGYSLTELLFVLLAVVILTLVAVPSVREHLGKTHRADAQAGLQEAAAWMERFYSEHQQYHQTRASEAVQLPAALRTVPRASSQPLYRLRLETVEAEAFVLVAVPEAGMATDPCGSFVLNHLGQQSNRGAVRPDCWRR